MFPLQIPGWQIVVSLIGHRVADASVHRFVTDVASLLRGELAG